MLWEQAALPLLARARRAGLLAGQPRARWPAGRRNVVLIHDVAALRHPEAYGRVYAAYQRRLLPSVARRAAARVVTVSEFSRPEIVELLGVPPERVEVVPNGVDERFTPLADPGPAARRFRPGASLRAGRGHASARKNLGALELAARRLQRARRRAVCWPDPGVATCAARASRQMHVARIRR